METQRLERISSVVNRGDTAGEDVPPGSATDERRCVFITIRQPYLNLNQAHDP